MSVHQVKADLYQGNLELGSQSCYFSANFRADVGGLPPGFEAPILGTMRCGQEETKFSANLRDNGAVLELQGDTKFYILRRSGDVPAAQPQSSVRAKPAADGKSAASKAALSKFVLEQLLLSDGAFYPAVPLLLWNNQPGVRRSWPDAHIAQDVDEHLLRAGINAGRQYEIKASIAVQTPDPLNRAARKDLGPAGRGIANRMGCLCRGWRYARGDLGRGNDRTA